MRVRCSWPGTQTTSGRSRRATRMHRRWRMLLHGRWSRRSLDGRRVPRSVIASTGTHHLVSIPSCLRRRSASDGNKRCSNRGRSRIGTTRMRAASKLVHRMHLLLLVLLLFNCLMLGLTSRFGRSTRSSLLLRHVHFIANTTLTNSNIVQLPRHVLGWRWSGSSWRRTGTRR